MIDIRRYYGPCTQCVGAIMAHKQTWAAALGVVLLLMLQQAEALKYPCGRGFEGLGFCDMRRGVADRVATLVANLTLQEKVLQLVNGAAGVPRLGLPPYQWWSEALHGVSNQGPGTSFAHSIPSATSFPQVLLSAASFNSSLFLAIGQAISTEARAMYNMGLSGLTYWSPNINIFRDPRWGRGQETPGEDPLLVSSYAVNFVQGLQSIDASDPTKSLKVAACCKHYTAYDIDQWKDVDRFHYNANVNAQDLGDSYQPPFQACIEEGASACVMCSYNRVNGVPSCADKSMLNDIVRDQWGLNGYIVSDCDSVEVMYDYMHYTTTPMQAVADSILAGLDLNCGDFLSHYAALAVAEGLVHEEDIDKSLTYLYTTLMRLGYFDGNPRKQKYGELGPNQVCSDEHKQLAVEAAKQGMVLLKNLNQTLPLSKNLGQVAVIGPNADASEMLRANYAGLPCRNTTVVSGIERYADVLYLNGCSGTVSCDGLYFAQDLENLTMAVEQADAVVLVMGLDQTQERESFDRTTLLLPGQQKTIIEHVANSASSPIILVIMSGGPVDISFAQSNPSIGAILWGGYPGEAGGEAVASILFGDHNPSGRLPNTWYTENYTQWSMADSRMRSDPSTGYPGRTYRFQSSSDLTLYEFGYGLSYSNFSMSIAANTTSFNLTTTTKNNTFCDDQAKCDVLIVDDVQGCFSMEVNIDVHNGGPMDGTNTVLLLWHPPAAMTTSLGAPLRQLIAFQPQRVPANQTVRTSFPIDACKQLSFLAPDGLTRLLPLGSHSLSVIADPIAPTMSVIIGTLQSLS
ncbi:hypothetical protein GOP47_0008441 [Adiantum capillus-veneris]|uniref:Fibronectin type III-like domain-containing protein n=1 Tax=Adiantum capillus-veneris TaxID=13818 RepID=A0A9D4ZKF6_ADICA|nr:hypothetical protein GOP47_0008441 [Adiantum capillus-veneris]